jgi:iron(III) transport system substrate-binding protein
MRRSFRGALSALAGVLASVLLLAACGGGNTDTSAHVGGSWDEIVQKATAEGSVTVYSGQGSEQLNDLKARFEKKYPGIVVNVVRALDSELAVKVDAELKTGSGIADVFVTTGVPWLIANAESNFVEPKGSSFDAPEFDRAHNVLPGGYFVVDATVLTFGWNTQQYPQGVKDFSDLLDPALAGGKLGIKKPAGAADLDFYNFMRAHYGDDYVKKLAAQKPRLYTSALPMAQALTSGEIAVGNFVQPLTDEMKAGAPVNWGLAPKPWGALFYGAQLKSAPHPNAAQLLADFMVTKDGQTAIARKAASVLPGIEGAVSTTAEIPHIDPNVVNNKNLRAFLAEWDKTFSA